MYKFLGMGVVLVVILGGFVAYNNSYKGTIDMGTDTSTATLESEKVADTHTSFVVSERAVAPVVSEPVAVVDSDTVVTLPVASNNISVAELAQHNSQKDCWIVYKGKVFDVTAFLSVHPGGQSPITRFCGIADASFAQAFEQKHGMRYVEKLNTQAGQYEGDIR